MRHTTIQDIVTHMTASQDYLIFSVGDSITEGYCATDAETTYTAVLTRGLARQCPRRTVYRYDGLRHDTPDGELLPVRDYQGPLTVQSSGTEDTLTVVRSGIGGNTVRRLLNRKHDFMGKAINGRTADLFLVVVGINDALACDPAKFVSVEQYGKDLQELIREMETSDPGADIIFMTPTFNDLGLEPISTLDPYVDKMKEVAAAHEIPLIDLHKLWMDHWVAGAPNSGQGDWLNTPEDHCHPGDVGHEAIANAILSALFN